MNTETFLWALLHCWICSKKWIFFSSSHLFQVLLFLRHLCSNFGLGKNKKFRGLLAFYTSVLMKVKVKSLSHVWLFLAPRTVAYQAPPSVGFSRQEYWTGLPFPSPGNLPHPGIKLRSPSLQAEALPSEPPGKLFTYTSLLLHYTLHLPLIRKSHLELSQISLYRVSVSWEIQTRDY